MSSTLLGFKIIIGSISLGLFFKLISGSVIKPLLKKTKNQLDDDFFNHSATGIFWTIVFVGIYWGLPYLGVSHPKEYYKKIILTYIAILWSWVVAKIVITSFEGLIHKYKVENDQNRTGVLGFLKRIAVFVIGATGFAVIFVIWNINITPILASAGVAGVAIGFAAKDTVSNFFGGISIFFDHPYKVGDYVIIEEKYRGEVIKIGIRSTKIKTRDNVLLTIPNSVMVTGVVVNENGYDDKLRIRIPLGISYDSDLEKAEKILVDIIENNKDLVNSPQNPVLYRRFGPSTIRLEVLAILNQPAKKGQVVHQLIKIIQQKFAQENIKMPAPQREIKIKK
jgi:small-conductance mechanosensitive channel